MDPKDVTGVLEDALIKVTQGRRDRGQVRQGRSRRASSSAGSTATRSPTRSTAGVLTEEEAAILRLADEATDRVIKVDDFEFDAFAPSAARREAARRRAAE